MLPSFFRFQQILLIFKNFDQLFFSNAVPDIVNDLNSRFLL